ncbi:ABC transporter ATP-binding protein [Pusillimonas noertemannii]|uniref:Branched-chain amino acid transport system ATP-binding protein n=1 Tax=Pusillimonas noertemannii TaxID=305977 RepID=A0A2U1CQU6_9BURK|nr:ATP-binding cassette domain-containing protein [Pusillimonas noertemannii]NYT67595.1 ATP-binding cassette domain-containing protein [Pusillimonas noertemannii]PVY68267.1 branched-chain amino acid transport system ATP-binding protein [Pusillimonas noertemannii]TFL12239.1 ATP-binding cassette domain-containing protein [Pusillimonas noertemannii]
MTPVLEVKGLGTGYGQLAVSRDLSLTLNPGETVGILGVNGAGKSTLLKTIVGLLPQHAGQVLLNGNDISTWPAFRRARNGVALVPEGRQVLAGLSVRDNLELTRASLPSRTPADVFPGRLAEVLSIFPKLGERGANPGSSLSGGEQQMLAIARALLIAPSVMMLDEPTQGLAPVIVNMLKNLLVDFKGRFAMVVVEQNSAFLESVADRILEMRSGRLIEVAATEKI